MKKARLHRPLRLTASFVVTVSAAAAATATTAASSSGCKKSTIDSPENTDESRVTLSARGDGKCEIYRSMSCPKGVMCNPPPPQEVDCPPEMRDASGPPAITRRPPGKERFLRVPSRLYVSKDECVFYTEHFCSPPGKPKAGDCSPYPEAIKLKCSAPADAGAGGPPSREQAVSPRTVESFIYKDGVGSCHKVPALQCMTNGFCEHPDGDPVPCP